jgi:hypothetical protein
MASQFMGVAIQKYISKCILFFIFWITTPPAARDDDVSAIFTTIFISGTSEVSWE